MAYIPPNPNGQSTSENSSPVVIASDQSPLKVAGQNVETAGFGSSGVSVIDDMFVQTPIATDGFTFNQTNSSLNILTGTTANAEFLARSIMSFGGAMKLRFSLITSQRIANSNLQVCLADLIGENLELNIVSTTLVDITLPGHGFTSENVGQFMNIGGIENYFTQKVGIPNRYAIQSIPNADTIRFTVAGWPASGTGTCTLFGYNQIKNLVTGAVPTQCIFDSQRNGWAFGETAVGAMNTSLSPGLMLSNEITGRDVFFQDALRASSGTPSFITRASRYENIPESTTPLYVFIWGFNGPTAPASSTTYTLASLSVEDFSNLPIYIQGFRTQGQQNPIPVQLQGGTASIGNIGTIAAAMLSAPGTNPDVPSAAITTSTTTAAFTVTGASYSVNIPVTAVTGTSPVLDVTIQESDDLGTNWFNVYSFPRIIATGIYRSPILPVRGNRIRYIQTVGGTTPSFTRSLNRNACNISPTTAISQLIDRSIVPTTLNSVTPSLNVQGGQNLQLVINLGTTTTPPALQLEGSEDNGTTWYAIGTPLTGVASSTVQFTLATMMNAQLVRARVSTAGATVVLGYVLIKGF